MKKVLKIEGMHCGGCEGRVKRSLEALPEVEQVTASHVDGTAVVEMKAEVSGDVLKSTVEGLGFTVVGVE